MGSIHNRKYLKRPPVEIRYPTIGNDPAFVEYRKHYQIMKEEIVDILVNNTDLPVTDETVYFIAVNRGIDKYTAAVLALI